MGACIDTLLDHDVPQMSKAAQKGKKGTVGMQFKNSLAELMSEMSVAAPHFIRCIKSNERKLPGEFGDDLVTKQLRYCGPPCGNC